MTIYIRFLEEPNIQNILNFKLDYPDYKLYKLEQNYRSTKNIVECKLTYKHNEKQIEKEVWTNNKIGDEIIIYESLTDNDEGRLVNTIKELLSDNNYNNFVLYRTTHNQEPLEEGFLEKQEFHIKFMEDFLLSEKRSEGFVIIF